MLYPPARVYRASQTPPDHPVCSSLLHPTVDAHVTKHPMTRHATDCPKLATLPARPTSAVADKLRMRRRVVVYRSSAAKCHSPTPSCILRLSHSTRARGSSSTAFLSIGCSIQYRPAASSRSVNSPTGRRVCVFMPLRYRHSAEIANWFSLMLSAKR